MNISKQYNFDTYKFLSGVICHRTTKRRQRDLGVGHVSHFSSILKGHKRGKGRFWREETTSVHVERYDQATRKNSAGCDVGILAFILQHKTLACMLTLAREGTVSFLHLH